MSDRDKLVQIIDTWLTDPDVPPSDRLADAILAESREPMETGDNVLAVNRTRYYWVCPICGWRGRECARRSQATGFGHNCATHIVRYAGHNFVETLWWWECSCGNTFATEPYGTAPKCEKDTDE